MRVTIKDMMETAKRMLFFVEKKEKETILYLFEEDLKFYLKGYGYYGFKEFREELEKRKQIAQENQNLKMIKVYSIMLYLLNNLEDYYMSRFFEKFFDIEKSNFE